MKRWTLRILLCLILLTGGAITTVAVAWGCVFLTEWSDEEPENLDKASPNLATRFRDLPPFDSILEQSDRWQWGDLSRRRFIIWPELTNEALMNAYVIPREIAVQTEIRYGVPSRALAGDKWLSDVGPPPREDTVLEIGKSGADYVGFFTVTRWFPTRPIWPGFVIDTLFYGAIWGGVWFGFAGGKRFIRSKRGRCPRCGYDLRGALDKGCSECGWNRAQEETERLRDGETK